MRKSSSSASASGHKNSNSNVSATNVISIKSRQKLSEAHLSMTEPAPILDMTERRNEKLVQERREVRRTILTQFIGAFIIIPQRGLCKVSIYDISENGMAFDVEVGAGRLEVGEEAAMRVYLNQHTYFPFVVRVANVREITGEGVWRHGANFVKGTINDVALKHFIRFIESVSASLLTDHGDVMVSQIRR